MNNYQKFIQVYLNTKTYFGIMPVDGQIPYCTKYKMTTKTSLIKE